MFTDKQSFVTSFQERFVALNGKSFAEGTEQEVYQTLATMVREHAIPKWINTRDKQEEKQSKQVIYFSLEFLLGRFLYNNLLSMDVLEVVQEGLEELGFDFMEITEYEPEPGLGNGGLGRLAACFLDSLAALSLPGHGNGIRYRYGLFKQKIVDGYQVELPDNWLRDGNMWETRRGDRAFDVNFGGWIEMKQIGDRLRVVHHPDEIVRAVPYDMPIIGYKNDVVNTLRLWNAESPYDDEEYMEMTKGSYKDLLKYKQSIATISEFLYPDDTAYEGKVLRLKQQYFFVSAGIQSMIASYLRHNKSLKRLGDHYAVHINDTHPVVAIPELMRILMDDHGYGWDEAWRVTKSVMSFTNHTLLAEALEKWPVEMYERLLPRIYQIIEEINRRFCRDVLVNYPHLELHMGEIAIVSNNHINMANLAVVGSHSTNGVARIHTDILKQREMRHLYEMFPLRFNNKTNGITHRRWLLKSNPRLSNLITDTIGPSWIEHPNDLEKLMPMSKDASFQEQVMEVKQQNKLDLASYIQDETGIAIDPHSIFDVQVKRLHAYKRQLMNAMHIHALYQKIQADPTFTMVPRTFIFGAKAAPGYHYAKEVIRYINALASMINNDKRASRFIKIVFLENYRVSMAERIFPGSDISEQISTASYEASGTGNMKFMMNGALTIGTLDGANIEIRDAVGDDHIFIFGLTPQEVMNYKKFGGYHAADIYHANTEVRNVVDGLVNGTFEKVGEYQFQALFDSLLVYNDDFLILKDFASYMQAQRRVDEVFADKSRWAESSVVNTAKSGIFSSDRTITEYANAVWNIKPTSVK